MKKHLILLLALALGLTACDKTETFNVNVSLKNGNDQTVYLQKMVDNAPVTIDSAIIADEAATLKAPIDNPQILYMLKIKDKRGFMPFFADNKDVTIVGDINNPKDMEVMASETQNEMDAFNEQLDQFDTQIRDLYTVMNEAFANNDSILMDSLNTVGTALMEAQDNFRDDYIKAHPESFIAHYILDGVKQDYTLDQLKEMVGAFTTESIYKTDLEDYIAKLERLEVGQPFIDFTLQTNEGNDVVLSEIIPQNKLTLVDFWASWCGPCRKENPVVKAAYEQYHDKGFEVIAVSVDREEDQWLQAVEADELPYTQVRDAENTASEAYMIYYIPANFLFDQEGKMVAKGLRGEDLMNKLAEMLQ